MPQRAFVANNVYSYSRNWNTITASAVTSTTMFNAWTNVTIDTTTTAAMWYGANLFARHVIQDIPMDVIEAREAWIEAADVAAADRARVADERQRAREQYNAQARETQQRQAIAQAERVEASARAKTLLFEHLCDDQRAQFEQRAQFRVTAASGRVYELRYGTHGNVYVLDGERPVERLCIAPNQWDLPLEDVLLAQKLAIEADETTFRRIANISNLRAA